MILANSEAIYLQELELAKIIADKYTWLRQQDSPFQPSKEIVVFTLQHLRKNTDEVLVYVVSCL